MREWSNLTDLTGWDQFEAVMKCRIQHINPSQKNGKLAKYM